MARIAILICLVPIVILVGAAIASVLRPTAPAPVTLMAPKILTVADEMRCPLDRHLLGGDADVGLGCMVGQPANQRRRCVLHGGV